MTQKQIPSMDFTSILLLFSLATVWGGSFFFAEIALREVPPLTVALHRVFWAVPALFLVVWWQGIKIPKTVNAWLCYLMMGALNNALPFSFIFWGQTEIGSNATLGTSLLTRTRRPSIGPVSLRTNRSMHVCLTCLGAV